MTGDASERSMSVCMATYNGAAWVRAQLDSILAQLPPDAEVIVVDDCSHDDTVAVVRSCPDPRVRLFENPSNTGYVKAFERALFLATGEHVFLADQDDLWPEGRVVTMQEGLTRGAVVAGNLSILDGASVMRGPFGQKDWHLTGRSSGHTVRNLARLAASNMPYFGCAMAMRRDLLDVALPFPPPVKELHDAWLALVGLASGSMVHLEERVVLRREHETNASGTVRAPLKVARGRLYFLGMAVAAWWRVTRARLKGSRRDQG